MSTSTRLEQIELSKALRESEMIHGTVLVDGLRALHADLLGDTATVAVKFRCFTDEDRRNVLEGQVESELEFVCQRCLTPLIVPIQSEFRLLAMTEQMPLEECPDRYEPFIVSDGVIDVKKLVREELVLNFPLVAAHKTASCTAPKGEVSETQRPFADLDKLLKKS